MSSTASTEEFHKNPSNVGSFRFWRGPGTCNFIEKTKGHALHHPNPGLSQFNANNNPQGEGGATLNKSKMQLQIKWKLFLLLLSLCTEITRLSVQKYWGGNQYIESAKKLYVNKIINSLQFTRVETHLQLRDYLEKGIWIDSSLSGPCRDKSSS